MELSTREKTIIVIALTMLSIDNENGVNITREEIEPTIWKFLKPEDKEIKITSLPEGF